MLFWNPDQNNAHRFSGFQPEARLRATLGQDAPHGLGVSDPSPCAPPRQALCTDPFEHCVVGSRQRKFGFPTKLPGRKRPSSGDFSDLRSEARSARCPLSLPHGLGVSDPSPCAPPRQALCASPVGHCVVGFCGTARVERAGPVWTKNRSGRAVTCVSFPPSQRRAPFRGFHKGASPLCVLFTLLFAQAKNKPSARTGPGILCRLRHTS